MHWGVQLSFRFAVEVVDLSSREGVPEIGVCVDALRVQIVPYSCCK